jgi:hypothetical protein
MPLCNLIPHAGRVLIIKAARAIYALGRGNNLCHKYGAVLCHGAAAAAAERTPCCKSHFLSRTPPTHLTSQTLDTFLGALLAAVQPDIGWRVTFRTLFAVLRSARRVCVDTATQNLPALNTTKKCDSSV